MQDERTRRFDEFPRAATWRFYGVMLLAVVLAVVGLVGFHSYRQPLNDKSALIESLSEHRLMTERLIGLARLFYLESDVFGSDASKTDPILAEMVAASETMTAAFQHLKAVEPKILTPTDVWQLIIMGPPAQHNVDRVRVHLQQLELHTSHIAQLVARGAEAIQNGSSLPVLTNSHRSIMASTNTIEGVVQTEIDRRVERQGAVITAVLISFIVLALIVMVVIFRPLVNNLRLQMEATILSRRRMSYLANHDVLTGMPNRLKMRESVQALLVEAKRADHKAGGLLIDLDDFKPINDTYGHAAGDVVLKESARRITQAIEKIGGIGARIGGDEFSVAFSRVDGVDMLRSYADQVAAALTVPIDIGGRSVNVGCSIGAALFPDHGDDVSKLITSSDRAMYVAKERGAVVCVYGDKLYESVEHPERIRSVLIRALMNNEFEMHYQPTVRLADAKVVGAEALMRWRKPGQGYVSPGAFIPDAERTGAIVELTEFALNDALKNWRIWRDLGLLIDRVGVNVPEAVLAGPLSSIFEPLLEKSDGDLAWLTVEVTENVFLDEAHEVIRDRLEWLERNGAKIALDDFGTGFASLAHLRSFPFHCLKIDRSFVMDLREDANADAIVRSVVDLARNLKATVVAEGVETEAQRAFLLIDGCEVAQGYLFSKALPPHELTELLQTRRNLDPLSDDTESQLLRLVDKGAISA